VCVESVIYVGKEETFDIEVTHPCHNFIGNDLVVHNSFDCQSQRYTGKRIVQLSELLGDHDYWDTYTKVFEDEELTKEMCQQINKVFYFRPIGSYVNRQGNKINYTEYLQQGDMLATLNSIHGYSGSLELGYSEEHARDFLPQNIRQNFVVTFNARSLLHFCDMRLPADAQLEIRDLATRLFKHFKAWMPEVAEFYEKSRYGRNRLAP
jgi:thymidylate synthase (FAD)